jgi:SAM-dependent methyltransferase
MREDQGVKNQHNDFYQSILLQIESQQLSTALKDLKGKIGVCFHGLLDEALFQKITQQKRISFYTLQPSQTPACSRICGNWQALPFLADSIDYFILPHILDFAADKSALIKELWRCLIPRGELVITGFNAYYPFGLPESIKQQQGAPNLIALSVLRNKLVNYGFAVTSCQTLYFRPKVFFGQDHLPARLSEVLGQLFWPTMGAVYILKVTKPVLPITPARPRERQAFSLKGLISPVGN